MKWGQGTDKRGKPQVCSDGKPAWFASDCGRYTVSRAMITSTRALWDAWHRQLNARGGWELPIQLAGGLDSSKAAIAACVEHANGVRT